ncbi:hypothetical protein BC830DRAFT_111476 [Chytriomyces sp. MP71]|nr:hypothetical protein BC830DRAFT_111476 [Chytriomyces sp. MP71]
MLVTVVAVVSGGQPAPSRPTFKQRRNEQKNRLANAPDRTLLNLAIDLLAELDSRLPRRIIDLYNARHSNSPAQDDALDVESTISDEVDRLSDVSRISTLSQYLANDIVPGPSASVDRVAAAVNRATPGRRDSTPLPSRPSSFPSPSAAAASSPIHIATAGVELDRLKLEHEAQMREAAGRLADLEAANAALEVKLQAALVAATTVTTASDETSAVAIQDTTSAAAAGELAEKDALIAELRGQVERAAFDKGIVAAREEEAATLRAQLEAFAPDLDALEAEVGVLKAQVETITGERDRAVQGLAAMEEEVIAVKKSMLDAAAPVVAATDTDENALAAKDVEIAALKARLEDSSSDSAALAAKDEEVARLKERVEALTAEVAGLSAMESEVITLKARLETLVAADSAGSSARDEEIAALRAHLASAGDAADMTAKDAEIAELKARLEAAEAANKELAGSATDAADAAELAKRDSEIATLRAQIEALVTIQDEKKATDERVAQLETELATKTAQIVALASKNTEPVDSTVAAATSKSVESPAAAHPERVQSLPPASQPPTSPLPPTSAPPTVPPARSDPVVATDSANSSKRHTPQPKEQHNPHASVSSSLFKQLQGSVQDGTAEEDDDAYEEIKEFVAAFYTNVDQLVQVVRTTPQLSPPAILLPLKQVLLSCRQISETASLPLSFEDAKTIERKQAVLDAAKHNMSENLARLMDVTKRFALANGGAAAGDVEREVGFVRVSMGRIVESVKGASVATVASPVPSNAPTTVAQGAAYMTPMTVSSVVAAVDTERSVASYVEETRNSLNQQTTAIVSAIQALLQVLRSITAENMRSLLSGSVVPQILSIGTTIEHLITASDTSILKNAALFGCERGLVESAIVSLDGAKVQLEVMGGSLNSSVNTVGGDEDVRLVKHRVGTAAFALVKSMKEFCDVIGV